MVQAMESTGSQTSGRRFGSPPPEMPIPDRLNLLLVIATFAGALGLLWLASQVDAWWAVLAVGLVFSYLLLTNYALLHEATHDNLNSRPRVNYLLGVITGLLFPVPFSMIWTTHQGHHLRNRTDFEMFDLYYASDNKLLKYGQWYSILVGLFWPLVPLGGILAAFFPGLLKLQAFKRARSSSYVTSDIGDIPVWRVRFEVLLIVAFYFAIFWLLDLRWQSTAVLYACFAFNWSTRQYVGHAFTKRDVIEGAWNLKHSRLMSFILLHGEWDLNHHRRPDVSWYYLPRLSPQGEERPSYIRHYLRLWRGPRPNQEPAPESLRDTRLAVRR